MIQAAVVAAVFTPLLAALLAFGTFVVVQGAPRRLAFGWLGFLAVLLLVGVVGGVVVLVGSF